jgi:hypothetical protein
MRSVVVLLLLASCYQPSVQTGLPCSENGTCPAGQRCDRGLCVTMPGGDDASDLDSSLIDGAPGDGVDAAVDAPLIDAPFVPLAWSETTPLPSARSVSCVAAYGNRLYATGGSFETVAKVDVVTSQIQANGTLGAWTAMTDLPTATRWHGCAVDTTNPSLYVVGGDNATSARDAVYRASINVATGALGPWVVQPSLPAARRGAGVVWTAGTLYVIGGEEGDGFQLKDTVFRASTTITGIPGGWTTQAGLMPADYVFGTAVAGGRIYTTGGYTGDETVRVSSIGVGGALGSFTTTTSLPGSRERHVTVASGTYVYALGGEITLGGMNLDTALRAPIGPTGSLGSWTALPTMPLALAYSAGVLVNSRIYFVGGSDGTNQTARVFILSGL